ncbi:MAG: hypothetical protein ACW979_02600 [Candidatus Thorarchaeota archaeon]
MAAVKRSLTTSIESLAANAPDTMFGLIEFESTVLARNLENGNPVELPRDSFASLKDIMESTKKLLDQVKLVGVGKNSDKLKKHVQALRDQGGTALGPAVGMAYVIAKHRNVGRVVLLTDGLANEGIGALEGYQVTPASKFYEDLGKMFMDLGTAVDVVGIASGGGMELQTLGLLPEATGGQMYYVTPNELDRSLSELAGASLLGRDVEVRLVTPPGVRVKDASGVSRAVVDQLKKKSESKIGVVGEDHELYFEVEPEKEIKESEVPIQVQVAYTDEEVGATFVTQKAGEESFRGDREGGRKRIASFRKALKTKAKGAPKAVQAMLDKTDNVLNNEEEEIARQEEMLESAPSAAPSGAADEAFTGSLAQSKKSSRKLFDEEK